MTKKGKDKKTTLESVTLAVQNANFVFKLNSAYLTLVLICNL